MWLQANLDSLGAEKLFFAWKKNVMKEILSESLTMHGPAIYKIVVQGTLDSDWSGLIAGMSITERRTSSNKVETVLVGRLADQTALVSVLNALLNCICP